MSVDWRRVGVAACIAVFALWASSWIGLVAGTGENDVGLAGSRAMLVVWWAGALVVGIVGVVIALRVMRWRANPGWLLVGALPTLVIVALNLATW